MDLTSDEDRMLKRSVDADKRIVEATKKDV